MKPMRQYKARQFMQMGIPEVAEREKRIKNVFEELIAENVPNLKRNI